MIDISKEDKKIFLEKHKQLIEVKKQLKKEFVGLNDIIDEVIELIEPWYLFPDAQFRPTVINLFGMTGTGKTSLVARIFELLDMPSVLRFDTGEWVEKTEYQLSHTISSQIKNIKKDNIRPVFVLDEFQLGRTLDDMKNEIDRPNLRVVWDLLDSGKFSIIDEKWEVSHILSLYNKLNLLITEKNLKSKYGKISTGKKAWDVIFDEGEECPTDKDEKISIHYIENAIIPESDLYYIKTLCDRFLSRNEVAQYILSLENEAETLKFLESVLLESSKPTIYDFSNSIIFIIGNLDQAYKVSYDMNADIDPDDMYEYTKKITISDIKSALTKLYRPEQISRLGNNFVIYRSFNTQVYNELIELELKKIIKKIKNKFKIDLNFSDNVKTLIFKEGVFPSQGVRPVFSTITSLIETKIGKIIIDILKKDINAKNIYWNYENEKFILTINENEDEYVFEYDVKLKVDILRKSTNDDIQSLVGIHESGHVLASVYELNICPKVAVSKTLREGGFTYVDFPDLDSRKSLIQRIKVLVAGYAAEKLVFGEDNLTTGSNRDLETVTELALNMIKKYGMNGIPLQFSSIDFRVSDSRLDDVGLDEITKKLVTNCLSDVEKILKDNMILLLRIGKYLTNHSKIDTKKIKSMVKKYGKYVPKYKTKDNYYNYKNIVNEKLKK